MDVELPDGTIIEGVPEGTTKSQLMAKLAKVQQYPTPSQRRGDPSQEKRLEYGGYGGQDRAFLGSMGRGALDTIGGGAQLLSRGAAAMGLPESTGNEFLAGPQEVERQNSNARQFLEEKTGPEKAGFDPVRVATSAALTLPLTPMKYLQAPSALGRAVGAGGMGAVAGGLQEVKEPKDGADFWKRKGAQAAIGFGTGAISQPVAEQTVKAVVGMVNRGVDKATAIGRNMTGANSIDELVTLTRESLKRSGIEYEGLSEQTKQQLLDDVQRALGSHASTNPGAIARRAAFREEGVEPLRHWVTRDPAEFTWFENLSGVQGVGDPLKQRKADLDKYALDKLNRMRGDQREPVDVGTSAAKDLKGYLGQERGKTNVLYSTFKEIAPNVKGNPQRFVNDLYGGLESEMSLASLPPGVTSTVNKISRGEIPLTPSTLYQLQKTASAMRGSDGSVNHALGQLSRAIDRELDAISKAAEGQGGFAASVLKMARAQHAKVSGEVESSRILEGVDSGSLAPENFLANLMRADLKEIGSTWMKLGNDSKAAVRAQVVDDLKRMAFGSASDDAGKSASQARFNGYVNDQTTAVKLKVVLGEKRLQEIKRVGLMLESAHLAPAGSKVNTSNTASAALSFGTRVGDAMAAKGIPGGKFAQDTARRGAAANAMQPGPNALGAPSVVIDPVMEELLRRRGGFSAGLLGSIGAEPALAGLLFGNAGPR